MSPTINTECFLRFLFAILPNVVGEVRKSERLNLKIIKAKARRQFLRNCLEEKVVPRSMKWVWRSNSDDPFPPLAAQQLKLAITELKEEINNIFFKLRKSKRNLHSLIGDENLWKQLQAELSKVSDIKRVNAHLDYRDKLEKLIEGSPWFKLSNPNNVVNLSSKPLSKAQIELLGYGVNFSLPHQKSSFFDFIGHLDKNKSNIDSVNYNVIFMNLDQIFNSLKNDYNNYIPKRYRLALKELKRDESIRIGKADKGTKMVIMDQDQYVSKINNLLNDKNVYKIVEKSPLTMMQQEFNKGLKLIIKKYDIDQLKIYTSRLPSLPYLYGQPKIHKKDVPLRPIVSNVNCPSYKLAKWLAKELSPLLGNFSPSHLKHNTDLLNRLKNIIPKKQKFISFDVASLYTNVPVKPTLDFIKRKLPSLKNVDLKMPNDCYIDLIELCLRNSFFQIEDEFFEQIFGLMMGSPLSAILGNLFLEHIESEFLHLFPGIQPSFWLRYVDHVISVVKPDFDLD